MQEFIAEARVARAHPALPGHFPGRPLVPAVLLLDLVVEALRERLGALHLRAVPNVKFLAPVQPEEGITIHLLIDEPAARARFRCEVQQGVVAQGELSFERL